MPKLHELLAVESDREKAANAIISETTKVFRDKPDHFLKKHAQYKAYDEKEPPELPVVKELVTTVGAKLGHTFEIIARSLDVTASKENTNTSAKSDLIIDGEVILKDVPATVLLMIENRVKKWRDLLLVIPTLAPGITWVPDPSVGKGVFRNDNQDQKHRTKKVENTIITVPATDKFPAQTRNVVEDLRVGEIITTEWSSCISPAEKSDLLERCDKLLSAAKEARMRANCEEVKPLHVADPLVKYLLG